MNADFYYDDPPGCRETGCKSVPTWEVETSDGDDGETFTDYLCGRHVQSFLWQEVYRPGSWVKLMRRPKATGRR